MWETQTLKINLKLFASYRDRVGKTEVALDLPDGATVGYMAKQVVRTYPTIIGDPTRLVVAVNQEYQSHLSELNDGDEVALIPPVSGG